MLSSRIPVDLVRVTFLVRFAFCVALCAALSPIIAEGAPPADTTSPQDEEEPMIRETPFDGSFPLFTPQASTPVVIDTADAEVVTIAAQSFSEDVKRLSGTAPDVRSALPEQADEVILAGSVEQSGLVRQLLQQNAFDASHVDSGQWESFVFTVVEEPIEGIDRALVVAGSDPRGTAFGLFELSKRMGVSPWVWWADATVDKADALHISDGLHAFGPPSVKYRGIFLNDERWGLRPWSAETVEPELGNIGPKTYTRVFELLLRLKANHIWPAMHEGTLPFYEHPENQETADDYAIAVGTSHTEVMLYNNAEEWDTDADGPWDYTQNADPMREVWRQRVQETDDSETVHQIGIRGQHDTGMEGVETAEEGAELLEHVIEDQRRILRDEIDKPLTDIPQVFTPYKEVLDYYEAGVDLPSDATLMWVDDNYSYVRRFSTDQEQQRPGGGGVYYHLSYLGVPHPYLWLETTPPSLTWREMSRAWAHDMRENWIVNVGDLKRREWGMEFFLQMGWDVDRWGPNSTRDYFEQVAARDISPKYAERISRIMAEYYDLAFRRKPELMGFSFHWFGQDDVADPKFSLWNYGDEGQQRIEQYRDLRSRAERIYDELPPEAKAPFFQLVYYPVRGAASMNEKWLHAYKSRAYAAQGRAAANVHAARAEAAFDRILDDIHAYNREIEDGKWNGIVEYKPGLGGGAKVHAPPDVERIDLPVNGSLDVAVEGSQTLLSALDASGPVPRTQIEARADDARLLGPALTRGSDAKGGYLTRLNDSSAKARSASSEPDSLRGAAFDVTIEDGAGGRYALYAMVEHHDETFWPWDSPSWTVTLDNRTDSTSWNEDVGEGRFKVTEYQLKPGAHTVRFHTAQPGAKLRGIELVRKGTNVLPTFNRHTREDYFIDVVNTGQAPRQWTATPSAPWIDLSARSGIVDDESKRIQVSIDYETAPQQADLRGHVDIVGEDDSSRVYVPVMNEPRTVPEDAHVEDNGVVSIHAEHYREKQSGAETEWTRFDGVGYTGAAMALTPLSKGYVDTLSAVKTQSPALEYEIVVQSGGRARLRIDAVPSFPVHHGKPLRTAVSIDGGEPQWVTFQMGPAESRNWKYNVAQNAMSGSLALTLEPGRHTLTVWGTDPSVNVDKMALDVGGLRHSYLGPPETIVRSR